MDCKSYERKGLIVDIEHRILRVDRDDIVDLIVEEIFQCDGFAECKNQKEVNIFLAGLLGNIAVAVKDKISLLTRSQKVTTDLQMLKGWVSD